MFLDEPAEGEAVAELYRSDLDNDGYVMNLTRLWAWRPLVSKSFLAARKELVSATKLSPTERSVLVCATARSLGDSYCSLAWGTNLANLRGQEVAAQMLATGTASGLSDREAALAEWAQKVVTSPNQTTTDDISRLRSAGLDDQEISMPRCSSPFAKLFPPSTMRWAQTTVSNCGRPLQRSYAMK